MIVGFVSVHLWQLFTSVYGCGSATASKWYQQELRTIEDVRGCRELQLTEIQRLGWWVGERGLSMRGEKREGNRVGE